MKTRFSIKRFFILSGIVIAGLYALAHAVLGSQPVQKKVLSEIRSAVANLSYDLEIESIEFSAFIPKIYLNRVTIRSTPKSPVALPAPVTIDKIKIRFQPLALISKTILIDELVMFHPTLIVPRADELYRRIVKAIGKTQMPKMEGGEYTVAVRRVGIVDALVDVTSHNPDLKVRSRSLTVFVEISSKKQQTITVESTHLEVDRRQLELKFSKIDLDVDLSEKSIRVNRFLTQSNAGDFNVRGTSGLPTKQIPIPENINVSYEVSAFLPFLNTIEEIHPPPLQGRLGVRGTLQLANGQYSGSSEFALDKILVDGYGIGTGTLRATMQGKSVEFTDVSIEYGKGRVTGKRMTIGLAGNYPVTGQLNVKGLSLNGLLENLEQSAIPVEMNIDAALGLKGTLAPFNLEVPVKGQFDQFLLRHKSGPILQTAGGAVNGSLNFLTDRMNFDAAIDLLGGTAKTKGYISFKNAAHIVAETDNFVLDKLGRISELEIGGGKTKISSEIDVKGKVAKVRGRFEVSQSRISRLELGTVRGQAYFENALLSFESLNVTGLEPVTGNGYVDFAPEEIHHRFEVNVKRAEVNQVFSLFNQIPLDFEVPKGGELGARMVIEGGHDSQGIEVTASGQAKGFKWYGEHWLSGNVLLSYRPDSVVLKRAMLLKKSGGVDVKGKFGKTTKMLTFRSLGLRIEELDLFRSAPVSGELVGDVEVRDNFLKPKGYGTVSLVRAALRGQPIADSTVRMRTTDAGTEFTAVLMGERLRARLLRNPSDVSELIASFDKFDAFPALTLWMGRDVSTIQRVLVTGELAVDFKWADLSSVSGSGSLAAVDVDLAGSVLASERPAHFSIKNGALTVSQFRLAGKDGLVTGNLQYEPDKKIQANIDGKLDLQWLQPFIPGVEYGVGQTSMSLRFSGKPQNFDLLGNASLEEGTFRLKGIDEEFKNVQVQLSASQKKVHLDRFDAKLGGGELAVSGDILINQFESLIPNLTLRANRVGLSFKKIIFGKFSGDFHIRGSQRPYQFTGRCAIHEGKLTSLKLEEPTIVNGGPALFQFDVSCEALGKMFAKTDVLDAEFNGNVRLMGNTDRVGLLGTADVITGYMLFRETQFSLSQGNVRFESKENISPRFTMAGRALVREERAGRADEYEVNLQVIGTPRDYKIRLSSVPALSEPELISLLVLGVTNRTDEAGGYVDIGTTIVGQTPIQSKLQKEFGVDVRIKTQPTQTGAAPLGASGTPAEPTGTVPTVRVQKELTKKTRVSYSNTLDPTVPLREFKVEHMLNESFSANATAGDRARGSTTNPVQSYGLDLRYRFQFE